MAKELTIERILDWESEPNIYLYSLTNSGDYTAPIQLTFLEPTSLAAMVGVPVLITGRISRPGTVSLSGLGAAAITGDLWSYLFTPSSAGSLSITITATDENGTSASTTITLAVAAAAVFPAAVTPLARLQHDADMFQDLAGTVPATAPHQIVQRVNNVSPRTGYWQSPAAYKDVAGVRVEPTTVTSGVYPLQFLAAPGTSINLNDSTLIYSWIQRYGDSSKLMATGANPQWGETITPMSVFVNGAAVSLGAGFVPVLGARHTLSVRWTPTAVIAKLLINGSVAATVTLSATITSGHPGAGELRVGHSQSFAYETIPEAVVVNRAVSDSENDQLIAYAEAILQVCRPAFPIDQPLIAATGDSNAVGYGVEHAATWKFVTLRNLRAAYNAELLCTALVGTTTAGHAGYIAPFYDARRRKHVAVYQAGTNDLASGTSVGPIVTAMQAVVSAQIAAMRAQGWGTVICTIPDRRDGGANQATFDANRAAYNAWVLGGGSGADRIADLGSATHLGANGDADNTTYFSVDKIHMIGPAHAIAESLITAQVQSLLA